MGLKESLIERVSGGDYKKKDNFSEGSEDENSYSDELDLSPALESPMSSSGFGLDSIVDNGSYDEDGLEVNQDFNPIMQAANEAKQESSSFDYCSQAPTTTDHAYQQQVEQAASSNINDIFQQQESYVASTYQQNIGFENQYQGNQQAYQQQNYYCEPQQPQYNQLVSQAPANDYSYQKMQVNEQHQQYGMQDYASQAAQVIPEPAPATYGMNDSPNIYNADGSINELLEDNLLSLAKRVVLEDVVDTFESALITKDALSKLIESYLTNSQSPYTNGKAVLTSVIDEILDSDYKQSHYGELVPMILSSVKADLN